MTDVHVYNYPPWEKSKKSPKPTSAGSVILIASIFLAFVLLDPNALPSEIARSAAIPVGIGLLVSIGFDLTRGWGNLFRTDLVCLLSFYFFTLIEFLFPQEGFFDENLTSEETIQALNIVMLGLLCLVIGRHFSLLKPIPKKWLNFSTIPDQSLFRLLIVSAVLGYLYALWTVDFNLLDVINGMLEPRFETPWARDAKGGVTSLFSELSLFRYVIPPISGILWNRRQNFKNWQIIFVVIIFFFSLYEGFTSGTRSIFGAYLASFLAGYFLTLQEIKLWKILIPVGVASYALIFATRHMVGFRNMGLRRYIETKAYELVQAQESLAVDYNLLSMAKVIDAIPSIYDFLGWNMIVVFATKPVPRVLWSDKPLGLDTPIETIVGAQGYTVSITYVAEAYMMGGIIAVIIISLMIGAASNWWTRIIAQQSSGYAVAVGAIGFFVAALTMRSLAFFTTMILPIIGLIFFAKVVPSWIGANKKYT